MKGRMRSRGKGEKRRKRRRGRIIPNAMNKKAKKVGKEIENSAAEDSSKKRMKKGTERDKRE